MFPHRLNPMMKQKEGSIGKDREKSRCSVFITLFPCPFLFGGQEKYLYAEV